MAFIHPVPHSTRLSINLQAIPRLSAHYTEPQCWTDPKSAFTGAWCLVEIFNGSGIEQESGGSGGLQLNGATSVAESDASRPVNRARGRRAPGEGCRGGRGSRARATPVNRARGRRAPGEGCRGGRGSRARAAPVNRARGRRAPGEGCHGGRGSRARGAPVNRGQGPGEPGEGRPVNAARQPPGPVTGGASVPG